MRVCQFRHIRNIFCVVLIYDQRLIFFELSHYYKEMFPRLGYLGRDLSL